MNMKHKQNEVNTKTMFACQATKAKKVFLAGTFNDWNPTATRMQRTPDGSWRAVLDLAPGRYEYKFVVDGNWCCEPGREDAAGCPNCVRDERAIQCSNCVPNGFGTMNRVVEVNAARTAEARAGKAA